MNMIVKIFLSMSFSGSLFILALFIIKYFLKNIISRRWQYYIWLIVILRLLLPFVSEINLMEKFFETIESNTMLLQEQEQFIEKEVSYINNIDLKYNKQEIIEMIKYFNNVHIIQNVFSFLSNKILLIWIIIVIILFVRKITIYQSFIKYINLELTPVSDTKLLDRFFIIAKQLGIKKPIELCVNPLISSPLLIGFFRPYIVLPCINISEKDFSYIILHELIHYKRKDVFYKWLVQITVCLHWFNPFVYFMANEINKACEFSCDESVIIKVGYSKAQEYGRTLLDAMVSVGKYKESIGSVTLSKNKILLKERLGAIMNFKRKSKLAKIMTIILTLCVIFGVFFIGIYPISASSIDYKLNNIVNKSDDDTISSIYRYTQDGYYKYPYIFEIGWNVQENNNIFYITKTLTLDTGEQLTIYLSNESKNIINDEKVIKALISLLTNLYNKTKDSDFPMIRPLIVSTQYIGDNNITDLAEKYYKEESLQRFGTIFSKLNETMQKEWLNRIYTDNKIAFFSVCLNHISSDSYLILQFSEKAYYEGNIAFFSVLTDYMNKETLNSWLIKAKTDKKINFQSVLLKATGNEDELEYIETELEKKLIDEYKIYGIIKSGKSYYYENQLVNVFMDIRKDSSFYTLDMNPLGKINIRVSRNEEGKIQSVDYMTKDEVSELFEDKDFE